jgi:hypothetical protein
MHQIAAETAQGRVIAKSAVIANVAASNAGDPCGAAT